ncbi:MAG: DUF721 domain-containing protein [Ignavibacteriota bacterium]|nr:DUF721 domain-containing protein [Ignavibacteriota bacterium]
MISRYNFKKRTNRISCLEDEISNIIDAFGINDKLNEIKIAEVWKECVGESISRFAVPIGIKNHKLMVNVENSVWRFELNNHKEDIIKKLNEHLQTVKNKKLIKDIVFV